MCNSPLLLPLSLCLCNASSDETLIAHTKSFVAVEHSAVTLIEGAVATVAVVTAHLHNDFGVKCNDLNLRSSLRLECGIFEVP